MSGEQMSKEVKAFCNDIGMTLRALDEETPWSNNAELNIGLMKGSCQKGHEGSQLSHGLLGIVS